MPGRLGSPRYLACLDRPVENASDITCEKGWQSFTLPSLQRPPPKRCSSREKTSSAGMVFTRPASTS